jgi:exonuclease III
MSKFKLPHKTISIASWNINGLHMKTHPKTLDVDFVNTISKHDIVCFSETHTSPDLNWDISGYFL